MDPSFFPKASENILNKTIPYLHSIENLSLEAKYWIFTYTKNSIDKWVVATVRHSQPMATEEYDINVSVTEAEIVPLAWLLYIK